MIQKSNKCFFGPSELCGLATIFLLISVTPFLISPVRAQEASLQGRVIDRTRGDLLDGANAVLSGDDGEEFGAISSTGLFSIDGISPGRYTLSVTFVGYAPYQDSLTFQPGESKVLTILLAPRATPLSEVEVRSGVEATAFSDGAGLVTIRPEAIQRIPIPDVSGDLASYLVTLPGVVTAGDRGGQLFIRGGTPAQNLVLVDGMPVYQPFHIVGFYSAFPADIIAQADVFAGGFGARYGGRISSVIDITTRNGNKQRLAGAVSIAPFLSSLRLEIPIVPSKVSILANARESVIERISPGLLGQEMPFRFGDRFVKLHAFLNKTSSFTGTLLRTFDEGRIDYESSDRSTQAEWENQIYGGRYSFIPSDYPILAQIAVYSTRLESHYRSSARVERASMVEGIHGDINFVYLLDDLQIDFGIFGRLNSFVYDLGSRQSRTEENVSEGGGYIDLRLNAFSNLLIEPGIRVHAFSNGLDPVLEPRVRLSWERGKTQIGLAYGSYHQQILGLNNLRDVTDIFLAWAPVPRYEQVPHSRHLLASVQRQIRPWLQVIFEGYTKSLSNLAFARYDDVVDQEVLVERVDGYARGLDFRLEFGRDPLFFYAGYGLATVRYQRDPQATPLVGEFNPSAFHPPHDRRHQIHVITQAKFDLFDVSIRWQFGSGRPFTQIEGYYEVIDAVGPDERYHSDPGMTTLSYGPPFTARSPVYHRLDISFERSFSLQKAQVILHVGAINAYNRSNLFDYDLYTLRRINQLPFIPSAGIKVEVF